MIHFSLDGSFTESVAKKIAEIMNGKTYFNFRVSYSNWAGNCTLLVESDTEGYTAEEAKEMFLYCALCELGMKA